MENKVAKAAYEYAELKQAQSLGTMESDILLMLRLAHIAGQQAAEARYVPMVKAAKHFVWKVDTGRARSTESYNQFQSALEEL